MSAVNIYSMGFIALSCCAPADMSQDEVVKDVNDQTPTGISSDWEIADKDFQTGEPNGHVCPDFPDKRHWLLTC